MIFGEWEAFVIDDIGWGRKKVYLTRKQGTHREFLRGDGTITTHEEIEQPRDDSFFTMLTNEQAQALANALSKSGVHTTNDSKNAGLLEATNKHLDDMRRLVFKDKVG